MNPLGGKFEQHITALDGRRRLEALEEANRRRENRRRRLQNQAPAQLLQHYLKICMSRD